MSTESLCAGMYEYLSQIREDGTRPLDSVQRTCVSNDGKVTLTFKGNPNPDYDPNSEIKIRPGPLQTFGNTIKNFPKADLGNHWCYPRVITGKFDKERNQHGCVYAVDLQCEIRRDSSRRRQRICDAIFDYLNPYGWLDGTYQSCTWNSTHTVFSLGGGRFDDDDEE